MLRAIKVQEQAGNLYWLHFDEPTALEFMYSLDGPLTVEFFDMDLKEFIDQKTVPAHPEREIANPGNHAAPPAPGTKDAQGTGPPPTA